MAISSNHAFVADGESGLQVIDITNPASPQIVGSVDTPIFAYGVAISGSHAYVADGMAGLYVIDISNPASPLIVGSVGAPGVALGVAISGSHAYVADYGSGLQVIDITDPESPQIVGSGDTPDKAWGIAVSGSLAYVADEGSLIILSTQCEAVGVPPMQTAHSILLLPQNYPNPFNPHTTIEFELHMLATATLRIFDTAGRLVDVLEEGRELPVGSYTAIWTGRDSNGREVSSGMYYCRLEAAGFTETRKITLIR